MVDLLSHHSWPCLLSSLDRMYLRSPACFKGVSLPKEAVFLTEITGFYIRFYTLSQQKPGSSLCKDLVPHFHWFGSPDVMWRDSNSLQVWTGRSGLWSGWASTWEQRSTSSTRWGGTHYPLFVLPEDPPVLNSVVIVTLHSRRIACLNVNERRHDRGQSEERRS